MADKQRKIELLAPAGNWERFVTAIQFGADAVYLGTTAFSLRNLADNFTLEQVAEAVRYAHERCVKVYVTVNAFMRDEDLENLPETIAALDAAGADALIINDPSVIRIAKRVAPNLPLHLSTQANTLNSEAALFWHEQGIERIVLARELTLSQIAQMRRKLPETLELEAFVHGAMCISHSGRCLLSNYFTGRNANMGACTHPCRWKYYVMEESRPGEYLPVEENERGTYIFNSKDLCMIEHIPDLLEAGVDSLKIEGRMKTALYVAAVTRTYRRAIDDYKTSPDLFEKNLDYYREEIAKCTYRQFTTGFYYGKTDENSQIYDANTYIKEYTYIGIVQDIDENGWCKIYQRNKFSVGETIEVMLPDGSNKNLPVLAMEDGDRNSVESAPHPKQEIWINFGEALERGFLRQKIPAFFSLKCIDKSLYYDIIQSNHRKHI